ncbi:MAG TPA: SDR family NAD(P)-dependent oxidoreductase [Solirubrobacteraceae bacterium]|nr:SDR family NAD(P)-dependent oxidoreductase [Solirubrobacteraceae bacterium]
MAKQSEVVVITGASGGVGRAAARKFAAGGAHIGLIARGLQGLEAAAREVEAAGGKALVLALDVGRSRSGRGGGGVGGGGLRGPSTCG